MDRIYEVEYWVPEHVRDYLRSLGFVLPIEAMEGYIREWHDWMSAVGDFYSYRDTDGFGRIYKVHRRSIHPAMRVCQEWGSLLLNDKTQVVCEDQGCTQWLSDFLSNTGFMPAAQATVVKAFGMGTGAWALWVDADAGKVRIRHYDARMVIPLSWDEEGVSECAFVTRVFYRGKAFDQLQMHLRGSLGLGDGSWASSSRPSPSLASLSAPSLSQSSLSKSAKTPGGEGEQQQFHHQDVVVPLWAGPSASLSHGCAGTYRIVTVLFDKETSGSGKKVTIPFGKNDCTVFRKVMSTEDMIQEFAPALRTNSQVEAFRIALKMLGDLTGFGISYFDIDDSRGYLKTATEVASDSSALMRNVARHEHALEQSIAGICRALLCVSRSLGENIPDEGSVRVTFDDSIVTDTAAEKQIAMAEVGVTMHPYEYRMRFYGEDEATARKRAEGVGAAAPGPSAGQLR